MKKYRIRIYILYMIIYCIKSFRRKVRFSCFVGYFFKRLFGLSEKKSEEQEWLENKIKAKEQELEKIDEESHSIDDINDHFNN